MTSDEDIAYILIDSPISAHSSKEDIFAWLEELKTLPDLPEVRDAVSQAQEYLKWKKEKG